MKIDKINNTSFQKKLVAKCGILKDGAPATAKIYRLNKKEDRDYFKNASKTPEWKNSMLLSDIRRGFRCCGNNKNYEFCVMEDENKNLLGISGFFGYIGNRGYLMFLETAPNCSINNADRDTKYVGESLVSYHASKCLKNRKDFMVADIASSKSAEDFYYRNCKFVPVGFHDGFMGYFGMRNLVKQNQEHTGKMVQVIA